MAKGHVYHHKANEPGCFQRGCFTVLGVILFIFAICGCFAVIEGRREVPAPVPANNPVEKNPNLK